MHLENGITLRHPARWSRPGCYCPQGLRPAVASALIHRQTSTGAGLAADEGAVAYHHRGRDA